MIQQTVIKFLLPHVQRFAARYVADFLNQRREQRLHPDQEEQERPPDCPPCPPCPPDEKQQSTLNKIWLGLSGLLLGGAMGTIVYLFVQDARSEA